MPATKFFVFPFGVDGDRLAIPDDTQVSGSVSYEEGFGFDYQRDLNTDPAALAVPRNQSNQLYYDMTLALNQYQTVGTPNFVTTSDNGGTPFPYQKYAYVLYDDGVNGERVYQSLVNSNTTTPTDATKWRLVDEDSSAIVYNDVTFRNTVAEGDVVYWDSANSRYDQAIANGTAAMNAIGIADVTNKRVYAFGSVTIMTGLTPGASYYLSDSAAGSVQTPAGLSNVSLGIAKSATELLLNPVIGSLGYNFSVTLSSGQNIPANVATKVVWDTILFDRQNCFDTSLGRFTAVQAGDYVFSTLVDMLVFSSVGVVTEVNFYKNGVDYSRGQVTAVAAGSDVPSPTISDIISLDVGDFIEIYIQHKDVGPQNTNSLILMRFGGYRLPSQT